MDSDKKRVDYSDVTPATGMSACDKPIANSFANTMPTADMPAADGTLRADPDKTIPGPEAATGVDDAEVDHIKKSENSDN